MVGNTSWCVIDNRYMMKNTYRVSVKLADGEEHDENIARRHAKEKLMKRYYKSLDSKISLFKDHLDMINKNVFGV